MKKCTVFVVLFALLLSLGATAVWADDLPEVPWTAGNYAVESGEGFSPLGNMPIEWTPDFSERMDLSDGDLSDWYGGNFAKTFVSPGNMISWVGGASGTLDPGMPENWGMTVFCAADPTYLYMAFDVTDNSFAYATDAASYNGDAIQLGIDFGGLLGEQVRKNADVLANPQSIFYSFSCLEDGAPLVISRQSSDNDGFLSEAGGDPVKGAARKTDTGWSVELAMSLELLFDDYRWKAWDESSRIYLGSDENLGLEIGLTLNYFNRETSAGEVIWAASAAKGLTDENGVPQLSWTPYDNSSNLILEYQEGMHFDAEGLVIICTLSTTAPETEAPYDPDFNWGVPEVSTEPVTEFNTSDETVPSLWEQIESALEEETLRDAAESMDKEAELNAILEKYGCSAVMGMGSLTALMALAAAAYVVRKKK